MRTRWRTAAVTLGAIAVLLGAPMDAIASPAAHRDEWFDRHDEVLTR